MPASVPSDGGLSSAEATRRLAEHGPNEILHEGGPSAIRILLRQFAGAMIGLLAAAAVISALLGEVADAIAIGVIMVLNAIVGFAQEFRAERAVSALETLTAPRARVVRDGRTIVIPAREIVRDDLLVLEAGDLVAADARLVEAHSLSTNEAALTGESLPVAKGTHPAAPEAPLAERTDCVFMGTSVDHGTARAVVTATGMQTELGRIAALLAAASVERTPLQTHLDRVGRTLLWLALAVVAVVAAVGLMRGERWLDVLLTATSLAVAAVPEGLAVFVTIALAIGVQRMAARNLLVRRLPAVETLGCTTTICTDKTGTLTTGSMRLREMWGPDHRALLDAAAACSDAELDETEQAGTGDATELAILVAAAERGIKRAQIERERPRVEVEPFDSETKRMAIVRADGIRYVKGAIEAVLPLCEAVPPEIEAANADLGSRGLRVLAVARGREGGPLTLLGLLGLADPPRSEAIEAVHAARAAGIRTVMITGDHPVTALAIAREMGIVLPGQDPEELVHARASPEDKLEIVRKWKTRGEVVAMTGDGVNDAPALREAHVGIAMGMTGTEVARDASAMILADDNFASIVAAIREGRGIFENIRKTLVYLLAGNVGELVFVFVASAALLPLPLSPLQILWINLITDGFPALALVMDPADRDALQQPPRPPKEPILGRPQWRSIIFTGSLQGALALAVFAWALQARDVIEARSLAFSVLVFSELFRAFAARSRDRSFFEVGAFTNLRLLFVVVLSAGAQIAIHHIPLTQELFEIGRMSLYDCVLTALLGLLPVTVLELNKLVRRALTKGARS